MTDADKERDALAKALTECEDERDHLKDEVEQLRTLVRRCQYEGMMPVTLNDEIDRALGGSD